VPGAPGQGVPVGGTAGQFLTKIDGTNYNTDWTTVNLSAYLTKADNLGSLTNFATARDNLNLGTLNNPTFAGLTLQGSGANVGQYTPTSLSLSHTTFGSFVISPSSGITFPDTSVQTTAFPAGSDLPTGGMTGQVLTKSSNANYDADWATLSLAGYATEAWVTAGFYPLTGNPSGFLTSAPVTSVAGRTGAITLSNTDISGLGSLAVVNDAPSDGSQYARKNGAWDVVTATSSYITSVSSPLSVTSGNLTIDLSAYAPLASPVFTGDARAVTPAFGDNDTSIATTAFVQAGLLGGTANARNLEVEVRNQSGSTIAAGSIVYISGATGNKPLITLAQANNDANSAQTIGFVKTSIANNGTGFVIVRGELENIDTSALTEGVQLYLSPTVAGSWTTTKPSAPQHLVYVGIVIRSHPTHGTILVAVQNGYELGEIHDVSIGTLANNDLLAYESSTDLWKNKTYSALGLLTSADAATTYAPKASPALTGNVTITSDSTGAALFIEQSGTGNILTLHDQAADTTFVAIDQNGKINTIPAVTASAGFNVPHGVAPTTPVNGDIWTTTSGLFARINAGTQQYAALGSNVTFSNSSSTFGSSTAAGTINVASGATISGSTKSVNIGTAGVAGSTTNITVGPVLGASTTSIGATTATSTLNLATGATLAGSSKTVNIFTNGVTGSSNTMSIGPSAASSTIDIGPSTFTSVLNLATGVNLTPAIKTVNIGTGTTTGTTNIAIGSTTGTSTTTLQGTTNGVTAAVDTNSVALATTAYVVGQAGSATPLVNGTAAVGTSLRYARQDHVHPTDTSRAAVASPSLTGTPLSTTAAADTNTTQIATTAFVIGQASSTTPSATGTAAVGTSLRYARADHVHANPLPTGGTTGQVLSKVDGTNYNVAWTTVATGSSSWGSITGTLSSQTDLQSALDAKLSTATAASTYQTISGMSSYLTTAAAATTYYPLTGNPSGFLTSAPVTSVAGRTGAITLANTDISGLGTMATATAADYSTTTVANGLYYPLSGNPSGFLTSSSLTGYATESFVTSQGYITSSALTPYAPLAGATFTGKVTTVASATGGAGLNLPHGAAPTTPVNGDIWTTTGNIQWRRNGGTQTIPNQGTSNTFSAGAKQTVSHSATTAGLNVGPVAGDPSTPANGDVWLNSTTNALNARVSGASHQLNTVKAWVNFNGTGTPAIRASLNVSSITDNGVGDYTVNLTTAIADTNYCVVANSSYTANGARGSIWAESYATSTTSTRIITSANSSPFVFDCVSVTVAILR
jgi:hypothetical protein